MVDTVLLVDDNSRILAGARMTLEMHGYQVVTASDGYDALHALEHTRPDVIVSDILMPGCDGFTFLEVVRARQEWITIPFIFLTALGDDESVSRGRMLGVDEYLTKPFSPSTLAGTVKSRLERARSLQTAVSTDAYLRMVIIMANAIESRDLYTGRHVERVSTYALMLARCLKWSEKDVAQARIAGILHDIGKVQVPDSILNKPGGLEPAEYETMKLHSIHGSEIVAPLKTDMPLVVAGVRHHHERFDGSGYPDGLAGDQIPAIGRLLAIVDTFDAMAIPRPYRGSISVEDIFSRLKDGSGTQFDPVMLDTFIEFWKSQDWINGYLRIQKEQEWLQN